MNKLRLTISQSLMLLIVVGVLAIPSYTFAASNTQQIAFCKQLDAQRKEQLAKVTLGVKTILDKETKVSDTLAKRNDVFINTATSTLASQKETVENLINDLSSIAETDEEKAVVANIQTITTLAIETKEASTTEALKELSDTVASTTAERNDLIQNALTTYQSDVTGAFDTAAQACASGTKTQIQATFESQIKAAKTDLQVSEKEGKVISDTLELAYNEAKLKLAGYDKSFTKTLVDIQKTIKKTFTEEN